MDAPVKPIARIVLAATFVAAAAALPQPADAATETRRNLQNGGSACTGALPTDEGALRKRPQAIANEGTAIAYVSCSAVTNEFNARNPHFAFVRLVNASGAPVAVTCTMVNGAQWEGATLTPRTVTVPASGFETLRWGSVGGTEQFDRVGVNFSCALPPGVAVAFVAFDVEDDIGE